MKRIQRPNFRRTRFNNDRFKLPSEICRARPWQISPLPKKMINSDSERERESIVYIKEYGGCRLVVRSTNKHGLLHDDLTIFIALFDKMAGAKEWNRDTRIIVTPEDIAKAMGHINPWQQQVREAIQASLERLLAASVSVILKDEKGNVRCKGRFSFIQGKFYYDGERLINADITISSYMEEIERLGLGYYWLSRKIYYSLKGNIAQALYTFLLNQRPIYTGYEKGYEIRLSKLCHYLNYAPGKRPWPNVWQTIARALSQLQDLGAIKEFKRDSKRYKEDGGIIMIVGVGRKEVENKLHEKDEQKTTQQNGENLKKTIQKHFKGDAARAFHRSCYAPASKLFSKSGDDELAEALIKLHEQIKKEQKKISSKKLFYLLPGSMGLTSDYINWIGDNAYIKHYSLKLLDIENYYFKIFRREEASRDNMERDPLNGKSYVRDSSARDDNNRGWEELTQETLTDERCAYEGKTVIVSGNGTVDIVDNEE